MNRRVFTWALVCGALLAPSAFAHAMLERAEPAVGAHVRQAPRALNLQFSDMLDVWSCSLRLSDAAGRNVDLGPLSLGDDGMTLMAPIRSPLTAGAYTVHWRATSLDTHVTSGDFSFSVRR